jgi:hypothetical protein
MKLIQSSVAPLFCLKASCAKVAKDFYSTWEPSCGLEDTSQLVVVVLLVLLSVITSNLNGIFVVVVANALKSKEEEEEE